jgi:hypothetical protein
MNKKCKTVLSKVWSFKVQIVVGLALLLLIFLYFYDRSLSTHSPIDVNAFSSFGQFIAGISTTVGLIYLYLQVKEMKAQRENNDEPSLFVIPTTHKVPIQRVYEPGTIKHGGVVKQEIYSFPQISVDLLNIGRGHAIHIDYEWIYDHSGVDKFLQNQGYTNTKDEAYHPFNPTRYNDSTFENGTKGNIPIINSEAQKAIYLPHLLSIYLTEFSGEGVVEELLTNNTGNRIPNPKMRLTFMNAYGKIYSEKEIVIEFAYRTNPDAIILSEANKIY